MHVLNFMQISVDVCLLFSFHFSIDRSLFRHQAAAENLFVFLSNLSTHQLQSIITSESSASERWRKRIAKPITIV